MNNTFYNTISDTELGALVFSYIYKNRRHGISYILYKDANEQIHIVSEDIINKLPHHTIGVIDNGMFLPIE